MFNELKKIMFLSKGKTIPQKLSNFTNKLTHIEDDSVDEIEEILSDAIKLEDFILSYKGKMNDYLHFYYFNVISHLKDNLINLYENKSKDALSNEDTLENEEIITDIKEICGKYNDTSLKDVKKKYKKPKKVRKEKRRALPKGKSAGKKIGKSLKIKVQRKLKKLNTKIMDTLNSLNKKTNSLKNKENIKLKKVFVNNRKVKITKSKEHKVNKGLNLKEKINLVTMKIQNSNFVRKTIKPVIIASMILLGVGTGIKSSSVEVEADNFINNNNSIINDYDENTHFMIKTDTELMVEKLINNQSVIEEENIEVEYNTVSSSDIENVFVEDNSLYEEIEQINEVVEEEQTIEADNLEEVQIDEVISEENDIKLQIGEEISLIEGSYSYTNMYDAYFNENCLNPAYKDQEVERKVKTIIVSNGEELKNISSNEQLDNYLENGYEIIGCSVTNQYSVNGSVEGYYRFDSIKTNEYQKVLR